MHGQRLYDIVKAIPDPDKTVDKDCGLFRARSSGRLIEEVVELCLACGLHGNDILGHVADAIHNESKKTGYYPSQLRVAQMRDNLIEELADCALLIDYLAFIHDIPGYYIDQRQGRKLETLAYLTAHGKMCIVNGLMYKKADRRKL